MQLTIRAQAKKADVTITLTRDALNKLIVGTAALEASVKSGDIKIDGDKAKLKELFSYMDTFNYWFNIVTP